jgi:hypothetical protein
MTEDKISSHQQRRQALIDIVENCQFRGRRVYIKSEKAPDTYVGTNVEDASRITIQLAGNNLMVWKINYKVKSQPVIEIDPEKFRVYIYAIVGIMLQ